jgi:peptidoglycan hydrolase-like protein with peptidoglycan-binding domain
MTTTEIQAALARLGYDPGKADGIAGKRTTAAVVAFQRSAGIDADGKAGPITQAALTRALAALETPSATPEPAPSPDTASRIVAAALAHVGLGYGGTQARRLAYAEWLFPLDNRTQAQQMASAMSSCGLHALACWRVAGVQDDALRAPYATRIGRAVADVVSIAQRHGAWVDATRGVPDTEPQAGDVVLIGRESDPSYGGVSHVVVVTGRDGAIVESSDGGQPDPHGGGGCVAILARRRAYDGSGAFPWLRTADGAATPATPSKGRRVVGWAVAAKLKTA